MAHNASRVSVGFEPIYNKTVTTIPNPVKYELTPNVAFAKGDMVVLADNKVALATAANITDILGVMAESIAQADNPTAGLTYGAVYDHPDNVYRVTFVDQLDATATGGGTDNLIDTTGLASYTTADTWNGALLFIYEGTNAGCIRTVADYDESAKKMIVSKPFPASCDTTSKYIVLGNGAAVGNGINIGATGIVLKDQKSIDANAANYNSGEVGPLVCVGASKVTDHMLDVMIMRSRHVFG